MACGQTLWTVHEGELAAEDVRALLAIHHAEMRSSSPPDACHVMSADTLRTPGVRFFSLRDDDGRLFGVGALKTLDAAHGEVKSMRTAPAWLGRGVGSAMLDHLVEVARHSGMIRLSLETGSHSLFDAANRLYLRKGFEPCGPFNGYADSPFTRFYTKAL